MAETSIEWADKSLNFYTWACSKVSQGCKNCYMMTFAERFGKNPHGAPEWRGKNAIKEYRNLKSGDVVFVNSMSDTYHEDVPQQWIHNIHNMAALRPDVIFLLLTKRPQRAYGLRHFLTWPDNLWIGTSVESQDYLYRLDFLLRIPAAGHFLSAEPLLAPLPLLSKYLYPTAKRAALDWVIVGAESGKDRRLFNEDWARDIRIQCNTSNTAFMYKQGSHFKSGQNRVLDGQTWDAVPRWNVA